MTPRSDTDQGREWLPAHADPEGEEREKPAVPDGGASDRDRAPSPSDWLPEGRNRDLDEQESRDDRADVAGNGTLSANEWLPEGLRRLPPRANEALAERAPTEPPGGRERHPSLPPKATAPEPPAESHEPTENLASIDLAARLVEQRSQDAMEQSARIEAELLKVSERLSAQEKALTRRTQAAELEEQQLRRLADRAEAAERSLHSLDEKLREYRPTEEAQPEPEEAQPEPRKDRPDTALLVNEASFEDLRELGLSVNQAARVVAQRDQRGGISSAAEIEELYGLSKETIELLRRATR